MAGKKTGKRLLTWVLVLVMALSLLPLNALAKLDTGHKIDVTFTVLYVGDEFRIGYNYGSSEKTQFVCQYSTPHSDTAYNNYTIAISDIKAAADRASVNSGYQIVGWSKESNANPTTWSLNKSGTTACNKGTTIYLVAKNPIHILKDIGLSVDLSYKLIENLDLLFSTSIFVFNCLVDCNFFHKSIE